MVAQSAATFFCFCFSFICVFWLVSDVEDAGRTGGVPHLAWPHVRPARREHGRGKAAETNGQVQQ